MKRTLRKSLALLLVGSLLLFMFPTMTFSEGDTDGLAHIFADTRGMEEADGIAGAGVEPATEEEAFVTGEAEGGTTDEIGEAGTGDTGGTGDATDTVGARDTVQEEAIPSISLIWDLGASKFNSSALTVNEDNTDIQVSLNANATQTATLQMQFAMNGAWAAEPGEIVIRMPMHIFTDRAGAETGKYQLNLQENQPQGNTGFYYTIDAEKNELVITNFMEIGSGETFVCQIDYTFTPSLVQDGFSNTDITATYILRDSAPVESNSLAITTHTSVAPPRSLTKRANKYESWQTSWGVNPDTDSSAYYYVIWTVTLSTSAGVQPYEVMFVDEQNDGTFIGSSPFAYGAFVGGEVERFQGSLYQTVQSRYYLVKYPRSGITEGAKVTNNVTASLTGLDNSSGTPDHTITAVGEYTYTLLGFKYSGDSYSVSKNRAAPFSNTINPATGLSDKLLFGTDEDMVSVVLRGGTSYLHSYSMNVNAKGYSLTLDGEAGNQDDYGKRNYTTELIDDLLFLKDEKLDPDEYRIASCYITFEEYDYVQSAATGSYADQLSVDYANYGAVEVFYKTSGSTDWILSGLIRRTGANTYTYTASGAPVSMNGSNQIALPNGTSEVRFVHQGNQYRIILNAYITVELYSTAHVREILQSQSSCDLYNVCTLLIRDADNAIRSFAGEYTVVGTPALKQAVIVRDKAMYGAVVLHATDKITLDSFTPRTTITKAAGNHSDDGSVQTLVYTVNMYEYSYYGTANTNKDEMIHLGIVKEQTEGTFYDLLPKGTAADNITVKTYNTTMNSKVCEVDYYTVDDWQGSGRTMLIVHAKAPQTEQNFYNTTAISSGYGTLHSGFTLTYRLTNSYFNIVDQGIKTTNLVAYRSATGRLGNGSIAPVSPIEFQYYQKLDGEERDDGNNDTVYATCAYDFTKPTAALYGIFKQVKAAGGYSFGDEARVFATGGHTYQLRYSNSSTAGKATNLVIYDVLEELGEWRGTLESIDTAYAESKGIKPVVYYASTQGINPQGKEEHADLDNAVLWSTTTPQEGIRAIAIDLRYKGDGSLYEISPNETIYCLVNMTAPDNARGLQDKLAVNKVSYRLDYLLGGVTTKSVGISKETKVSLRDPGMEILKSSNPESGAGIDSPTAIGRGERLEYTVSVKNNEGTAIMDVEVMDTLPDMLTLDFENMQYFFGTDPNKARLIAGSDQASVRREGQKLTFVVKELPAGGKISFIIPTQVHKDAADGDSIVNAALITKINGKAFTLESNKTYHQTGPVLSLHAGKSLTGRKLQKDEFEFEVRDSLTGAIVASAKNQADGAITFSGIEYQHAGEYQYTIEEVHGVLSHISYDKTVFTVRVRVKHEEDGRLTATAAYPEGGVQFFNIYNEPAIGGGGSGVIDGTEEPPPIKPPTGTTKPPTGTTEPPTGTTKPPTEATGSTSGTNTSPTDTPEPPAIPPQPPAPEGIDGEWHWDDALNEWIFEAITPLGNLPKTGDAGYPKQWGFLVGLSLISLGAALWILFATVEKDSE